MEERQDLISRQAAIKALVEFTHLEWKYLKLLYPVLEVLEQLPSAQPERKNGEWQLVRADRYIYRCDVCKKNTFGMSDYCPNCGARMEDEG